MDLYIKHQPKTFSELIGNVDTKNSLIAKIEQNKLPHALLFTGESGTGKTTIGEIVSNEIGAEETDFNYIDAASYGGIDGVRKMRESMRFGADGKAKVYLLDEIHCMQKAAQNALLQALAKPPSWVYFILCTTDPQALLSTVKSRCTHYEMEMLNEKQLTVLINRIAKREKVRIPKVVTKSIVTACNGKPRRALTILEKVIHLPPDNMKKQVDIENETKSSGFELAQLLFKGGSWLSGVKLLKNLKNENPEKIRRIIYSYMISVISNKTNPRAHFVMYCFDEPLYDDGMNKLWYLCHAILNDLEI